MSFGRLCHDASNGNPPTPFGAGGGRHLYPTVRTFIRNGASLKDQGTGQEVDDQTRTKVEAGSGEGESFIVIEIVQPAHRPRRVGQVETVPDLAHTCMIGAEGIISKLKGSRYRSGRTRDWIKVKTPASPAVKRESEQDWGR